MLLNRRDALLALLAGPLAARTPSPAAGQAPPDTELIVCGWDEVFILALGADVTPAHRKVWSWRAADSPQIPADMQSLFRTTDDCKPVDGGRRILISSSGGGVALVDRETRRASFVARVTNAHSIEMLPGGRIAAAASVSAAGTGNRLAIFDAADGRELASDELRSGHGVVWTTRDACSGRSAVMCCAHTPSAPAPVRSNWTKRSRLRCPTRGATTWSRFPLPHGCSSARVGAVSISIGRPAVLASRDARRSPQHQELQHPPANRPRRLHPGRSSELVGRTPAFSAS